MFSNVQKKRAKHLLNKQSMWKNTCNEGNRAFVSIMYLLSSKFLILHPHFCLSKPNNSSKCNSSSTFLQCLAKPLHQKSHFRHCRHFAVPATQANFKKLNKMPWFETIYVRSLIVQSELQDLRTECQNAQHSTLHL